jgi:hypothetical protein
MTYQNPKKKNDFKFKEERTDLQRYFRDSLKYQKWMFYGIIGICMILAGIYVRLVAW